MMMDIDYFKNINDTYGHLIGDRVLIWFTEICQKNLREYDVFARYGGEEFVALLPETDSQKAYEIAERVRSAIASTKMMFEDVNVSITASVGVVSIKSEDDLLLDKILDRADQALYRSKQTGRNQVSIWGSE